MTEVPRVFESQVAGHKGGITTDESGALLIKSTSQRELDFYDVLAPALVPGFVGKWTPRFFGTLALHGQVKPGSGAVLSPGQVSQLQPKDGHTAVVLENLTRHFAKPCVIDIKLGKQLWDEAAPPEKRAKMTKDAAGTTIASKGLRLTGCRVYNAETKDFDVTPKEYGKTIADDQLGEAMRKCFPSQAAPRPLLEKIMSLLKDYQSEVQTVEWRLHGSSILIIYEGDPDRLAEGLQQSADQLNETPLEGDESDADSEDEPAPDFRPAVLVKAVDFAHAWDYRGHGPDSGYNEGVANFIALVQARLEEAGEANC